jgi:feruloyl esterase
MACDLPGANASACLTAAQLETASEIYQDYMSDEGVFLYPGPSPGCEGQLQAIYNQSQTSPFGINYLRFFVLNNPYFDWSMYNDSDLGRAVATNPGQASVNNWNLTEFQASGAKMIMYHGLADGLIPPRGSDWYYEKVVDTMGGNLSATQEYFRYFQVPGMQHCWNT